MLRLIPRNNTKRRLPIARPITPAMAPHYRRSTCVHRIQPSNPSIRRQNHAWFDKQPPRILISGAGLAGLTCARKLEQHKIPFTMIQPKNIKYHNTGSGVFLTPSSVYILRKLGLGAELQRTGTTIHDYQVKSRFGDLYGQIDLKTFGQDLKVPFVGISRRALTEMLSQHMVIRDAQLKAIEKYGTAAKCKIHGSHYTGSDNFDVVIGAEGVASPVRRHIYQSDENKANASFLGWATWQVTVPRPKREGFDTKFPKNAVREMWGEDRRLFVVPIENDQIHIWGTFNTLLKQEQTISGNQSLKSFREVMDPFGKFQDFNLLVEPILSQGSIEVNYPMQAPNIDLYGKENFVLIGDAAHGFAPNLHDGATLAMEDGFILGEMLSRWQEPTFNLSTLGADFTAARFTRTRAIQKDAIGLSLSAQKPPTSSGLRQWLRHAMLFWVTGNRAIETRLKRLARGIDIVDEFQGKRTEPEQEQKAQ